MVLRTPAGTVLHTGDWKLDPQPLVGPATDEAAFAKLGDEGVLALVCDSTNAPVEGRSGSESTVRPARAVNRRVISENRVLLPAPLRPSNTVKLDGRAVNVTSSRA